MQLDLSAPVAHRNDATIRATGKILTRLNAQNQASRGCRDGTDVDALDTEQRIRPCAQPAMGNKT